MKAKHIQTQIILERDGAELAVMVSGMYSPATPDVHYLRNGDPGHPGDPEEVDDIKAMDAATGAEIELSEKETEQAWNAICEAVGELEPETYREAEEFDRYE
jgi:hypothetical protein